MPPVPGMFSHLFFGPAHLSSLPPAASHLLPFIALYRQKLRLHVRPPCSAVLSHPLRYPRPSTSFPRTLHANTPTISSFTCRHHAQEATSAKKRVSTVSRRPRTYSTQSGNTQRSAFLVSILHFAPILTRPNWSRPPGRYALIHTGILFETLIHVYSTHALFPRLLRFALRHLSSPFKSSIIICLRRTAICHLLPSHVSSSPTSLKPYVCFLLPALSLCVLFVSFVASSQSGHLLSIPRPHFRSLFLFHVLTSSDPV